jgi:hypothetical protein
MRRRRPLRTVCNSVGTVCLSCDVTDQATDKAVADAKVTYQAGTTEFATKAQTDGSCELNLPADVVAGVAFPAGSVEKPGYEPQTLLCSKLQGGDTSVSSVQVIPLADNVSIPVGGASSCTSATTCSKEWSTRSFRRRPTAPN